MMTPCPQHDKLEIKIDKLLQRSQQQGELLAAMKATLDTATVRRPEMYAQIDKMQGRINKLLGGLTGLLIIAGSVIAYFVK